MQNTRAISSAKLAESAARSRAKETRATSCHGRARIQCSFRMGADNAARPQGGRLDELNRDKFNERACFDTDVSPIGYNYTTVNCAGRGV